MNSEIIVYIFRSQFCYCFPCLFQISLDHLLLASQRPDPQRRRKSFLTVRIRTRQCKFWFRQKSIQLSNHSNKKTKVGTKRRMRGQWQSRKAPESWDDQIGQNLDWLPNLVVLKNKNGKLWICVDFTDLNKASLKESFPLHHIDWLVKVMVGNKLISFKDTFSRYNRIMMNLDDREKNNLLQTAAHNVTKWCPSVSRMSAPDSWTECAPNSSWKSRKCISMIRLWNPLRKKNMSHTCENVSRDWTYIIWNWTSKMSIHSGIGRTPWLPNHVPVKWSKPETNWCNN